VASVTNFYYPLEVKEHIQMQILLEEKIKLKLKQELQNGHQIIKDQILALLDGYPENLDNISKYMLFSLYDSLYNSNYKITAFKTNPGVHFYIQGESDHTRLCLTDYTSPDQFSYLVIKIRANNIFFSLSTYNFSLKAFEKDRLDAPAGKYGMKLTKKHLKRQLRFALDAFYNDIIKKKIDLSDFIIGKIIAPTKLRKSLVSWLTEMFSVRDHILELPPLKVFNGCRAKKKIRKKRKSIRFLK